MAGVRIRGEEIRQFILENVGAHPSDIGAVTADKFSISRQAVNNHLKRLLLEELKKWHCEVIFVHTLFRDTPQGHLLIQVGVFCPKRRKGIFQKLRDSV